MTGDDGVDIISSLPDEILQLIFSFIPTKFAVRTSVLSKRWRHVWSYTPSLSIDCHSADANSINKTLANYLAPKIMSFHLCVSSKAHQIDSLIDFARSRNMEKLSLEFLSYELFFYLHIRLLLVDSETTDILSWKSLRNLSLSSCKLSDTSLAQILSCSPLLESLTLHHCHKLKRLDLTKSLRLKRLNIDNPGLKQTVAPNIHFLRLKHSKIQCGLVDVSSLTEAYFNIYRSSDFLFYNCTGTNLIEEIVPKILEKFQNVKKLTFGALILEFLIYLLLDFISCYNVIDVPFPTVKVEGLTLETMIVPSVIPGIAKLLRNSPGVKTLKLNIVDRNLLPDSHIKGYLNLQGRDPAQCLKPKDLVFPTSFEPKLMTSFMEFLIESTGYNGLYGWEVTAIQLGSNY
ncbi:PREDICTED: F-box/LRR-repeat protein At5g02910-like [Camelina sativa]|uniref:F-box/LRR-repeat protein At5g02910-like n=1 Tax=Camelina sativa TaxID=90675 RepID=A0ABM0WPC5_CAMSA|nr:PREDICTED: F-box/LRR-repeat protein At5g02910-like [Camelina sativa]